MKTTCPHYNNYHIALQSAYLTASKGKEQQLQAELNTIRQMYNDKDQQISMLEQELQAKQEKVKDQFEERETEILEQKGEQNGTPMQGLGECTVVKLQVTSTWQTEVHMYMMTIYMY